MSATKEPSPSLKAGTALGEFTLLRKLGEGGFGQVWLAEREDRGALAVGGSPGAVREKVALKLMLGADDPTVTLLNEWLTARASVHPNVVRLLSIGQQGPVWYVAMEYVAGRTLEELGRELRAASQQMPPLALLELAEGAANGLGAVHQARDGRGVPLALVHRDIKPANLMVNEHGQVKLLDFGIAKGQESPTLTDPGLVKGTLYYMSPEQHYGEPLGPPSDLFSLGAVLYEALTGEVLFPFRDYAEATRYKRKGEHLPRVRAVDRWVPGFGAVLERCVAADPADRYPDASALLRDVRTLKARAARGPGLHDVMALLGTGALPPGIPREGDWLALEEALRRPRAAQPVDTLLGQIRGQLAVLEDQIARVKQPGGAALPRAPQVAATARAPLPSPPLVDPEDEVVLPEPEALGVRQTLSPTSILPVAAPKGLRRPEARVLVPAPDTLPRPAPMAADGGRGSRPHGAPLESDTFTLPPEVPDTRDELEAASRAPYPQARSAPPAAGAAAAPAQSRAAPAPRAEPAAAAQSRAADAPRAEPTAAPPPPAQPEAAPASRSHTWNLRGLRASGATTLTLLEQGLRANLPGRRPQARARALALALVAALVLLLAVVAPWGAWLGGADLEASATTPPAAGELPPPTGPAGPDTPSEAAGPAPVNGPGSAANTDQDPAPPPDNTMMEAAVAGATPSAASPALAASKAGSGPTRGPRARDDDQDGHAQPEDCDDRRAQIHPGMPEVPGDGLDNNCNGFEACFVDSDSDGYVSDRVNDVAPKGTCRPYTPKGTEPARCDTNSAMRPGLPEVPGDGLDNDCDAATSDEAALPPAPSALSARATKIAWRELEITLNAANTSECEAIRVYWRNGDRMGHAQMDFAAGSRKTTGTYEAQISVGAGAGPVRYHFICDLQDSSDTVTLQGQCSPQSCEVEL